MSSTTGFTTKSKLTPAITDGVVENATIALSNVEQSHTFPAGTVKFLVKARGSGKIKFAHTLGASGTAYVTISAGSVYTSPEFKPDAKTIYFQSPIAGLVVEMESWA